MEIEKALSGVGTGGAGDSGVGERMFGRLLEWLNDNQADVFFAATCNDIQRIMSTNPEFVRAGRFDGMFFFDMPQASDREQIWRIYLGRYRHHKALEDENVVQQLVRGSKGWTGAEIESCCRLSAILGDDLLGTMEGIVPVSATSKPVLDSLREWASGKCRSARQRGLYRAADPEGRQGKARRNTKRRTTMKD